MNRRAEPRFDVYHRATITFLHDPETHIDASLTDISGSGMRLVAAQSLAEEEMICVEIGQHLVLAEVRRSTPRGSRFVIGAEKVHTLNLLSLPESMGSQDRIQALVDDYHLRLQFALEAKKHDHSLKDAIASPLPAAEPASEPLESFEPLEGQGDFAVEPEDGAGPVQSEADQEQVPESTLDSAVDSAADLADSEAPGASAASGESLESNRVEAAFDAPPEAPPITEEVTPPAVEAKPAPPQPGVPEPAAESEPSMAPAMRADPAPAAVPLTPVATTVQVDFGQLGIMLPETKRQPAVAEMPPRVAIEASGENGAGPGQPGPVLVTTPPGPSGAAAAAVAPNVAPGEPLKAVPPDLPVQPIRITPPDTLPPGTQPLGTQPLGTQSSGTLLAGPDAKTESDPLRAFAMQQELVNKLKPETRRDNRTTAVVAAGLVAAAILIAFLFAPIRSRLLSPFASASEKAASSGPSASEPSTPVSIPSETPAPKVDGQSPVEPIAIAASPTPAASSPTTTPVAASPATPSPTPASAAASTTPTPAVPPKPAPTTASSAAPSTGSRVHSASIRASAQSWIWACADGKELAGRILQGGSDLKIDFSKQARVLVGNAGGVEMVLDGKSLGSIGPEGHARSVELTPAGFKVLATGSQECGGR